MEVRTADVCRDPGRSPERLVNSKHDDQGAFHATLLEGGPFC